MLAIDTEGMHPTTESCIEAMQLLAERQEFHNILDMGCGNGILSIISAGIWDAQVLGVDISTNAITDATRNIAEHGLEEQVTLLRNDGFHHPEIARRGPYDLIIFNLLAESLVRMAPDVKQLLSADGTCILSGMLAWLMPTVEETYRRTGFIINHRLINQPWHTWLIRSEKTAQKL